MFRLPSITDLFVFRRSKRAYALHKPAALQLAAAKAAAWNSMYGFKYNRVTVKDQKSRWGSCSSKGNLNFNYRILFLPERLVDYIVVHELCHLGEFNHSKAFWDLVAKTIPDHVARRMALRKYTLR